MNSERGWKGFEDNSGMLLGLFVPVPKPVTNAATAVPGFLRTQDRTWVHSPVVEGRYILEEKIRDKPFGSQVARFLPKPGMHRLLAHGPVAS